MAGIFKAYDIRGLYPEQLNEDLATRIGLSMQFLIEPGEPGSRRIVVGHDMRSHSIPLHANLVDGLLRAGFDVVDVGLVTTPMNYFAVGHLEADGGVQVTASHNPAQYNGMKMSLHGARPVSGDDGIPVLEEKATGAAELPEAGRRGTHHHADIMEAYAERMLSFVELPDGARKLKVVVDAANGMGAIYEPILEQAGIELDRLYFELDGTFPNHEANPLKFDCLEDLAARVVETGADLGVSFDGDADRAGFVDELGRPVGSDLATALIAGRLLAVRSGTVVYDVRSSRALPEAIKRAGGTPRRERVGHSFIKATLRETDGVFGGELAGHYYFPETYYADSSLLAVFHMLNLLRSDTRSMSQWLEPLMTWSKSPEVNFEVDDKESMMEELAERYRDGTVDWLDGVTVDYPEWWFNVRPSNTEPLLRLVVEAESDELLASKRAELEELLGTPV